MTHRLSALTTAKLAAIESCPIIPLGNVYEECAIDYAFDNYVNVVPDEKLRVLSFSSLEKYMTTVEHPGFTNVPRTGKQFSWYKNYINRPKRTVVTFDPPRLETYIPRSFGIALGIGKEIEKSLKVVKKITKKKTNHKNR